MIAAEIMTHPVLAIDPSAPVSQAIRLMSQHHVSGLPVVERDGQLAGILTEGDLLRRVEIGTEGDAPGWLAALFRPGHQAAKFVLTRGRRVRDVMSWDVVSVPEDTSLADVVALMRRHGIKRIPVVRDGRLLGIVSRADLVRRVGEVLSADEAASANDATIQREIVEAMGREPWVSTASINVAVREGVVELDGCVFDLRERDAMGVLAETVPGVKRVENRIACIELYSGAMVYDPAEKAGKNPGTG